MGRFTDARDKQKETTSLGRFSQAREKKKTEEVTLSKQPPIFGGFERFQPQTAEESRETAKGIVETREQVLTPGIEKVAAAGAGFLDAATLGLASRFQKGAEERYAQADIGKAVRQEEQKAALPSFETMEDVKELSKPAAIAGSMAGYALPYSTARGVLSATKVGQSISKLAPFASKFVTGKLTGKLGERAATAIGTAAGGFVADRLMDIPLDVALGVTEGVIRDQDKEQIKQNITTDLIFGSVLDFGINSYGGIKAYKGFSPKASKLVDEVGEELVSAHSTATDTSVKAINDKVRELSEEVGKELPLITTNKAIADMDVKKVTPEIDARVPDVGAKPEPEKFIDVDSADVESVTPDIATPLPRQSQLEYEGKPAEFDIDFDTKDHIVSKTKPKTTLQQKVTKATMQISDDLAPLKNVDQKLYQKALESRQSGGIIDRVFNENLVDSQGNVLNDSFTGIFKGFDQGKMADFEDYLVNKHAIEWDAQGKKVYPDEADIPEGYLQRKVADHEARNPEFAEQADKLYKWYDNFAKAWLVDTGLVDENAYNAWRKLNPNYVPFRRSMDPLEVAGKGKGVSAGITGQATPIKAAKGSERKIISPIESMMEDIDKFVTVSKRNAAAQDLYNILGEEGLEGVGKRLPTTTEGLRELGAARKAVAGMKPGVDYEPLMYVDDIPFDQRIVDIINEIDDQYAKELKDLGKKGSNVVTALVDGQKVKMEIEDPLLLEAITNLNNQGRSKVLQSVGKLTRAMKVMTTGINPIFSVARNIWRDIPTSYINSKTANNPVSFARDLVAAMGETFIEGLPKSVRESLEKNLNISPKWLDEYRNVGGGFGASPVGGDPTALGRAKKKLGKGSNWYDYTVGNLEKFNDFIESAPRLAEYKRVRTAGGSKSDALYAANEVTTNFLKKGTYSKELDQFVPYFNAAVQGLDKFAKTYKENPKRAVQASLTAVTLPTMILYAFNHDNPNYEKLSDWTKDNYYLIPRDDGTFLKIAKPREYGMIFSSLPERVLRQWNDKDPDAFKGFADSMKASFLPPSPLSDNILSPFYDIRANEDYAGRPIIPGSLEDVSPRYQYDEKTSALAKTVGDALNLSPMEIDYVLKSYTGFAGELGIPLMSEQGDVAQKLKSTVVVDPLFSNDSLSNFYENKENLQTQYEDSKVTGTPLPTDVVFQRRLTSKTGTNISELSKLSKRINQDKTTFSDRSMIRQLTGMALTEDNKEEVGRAVRQQINDIATIEYFSGIDSDIQEEMGKVYRATDDSNIFPNGIKMSYKDGGQTVYLTSEQQQQVNDIITEQINTKVSNYINSKYYNTSSNDVKARKIKSLVDRIERDAYKEVLDQGSLDNIINDIK